MSEESKPESERPVTLTDVKKLPLEEQRRILRAERDALDGEIQRLSIIRAAMGGALAMIED